MTIRLKKNQLMLPAIRSQMGDWKYYISSMRMEDIAKRVSYAQEIHKRRELNELLQREVSNRKKYIVKYLETQEQRFFNSIIVGVYKGSPEWYELAIGKNENFDPDDLPDNVKRSLGFLLLSGKEELFAIDGQHRVAAIKDVVRKDVRFKNEEVSVIFVAAKMDSTGKKRTRRLFSTLNRYAKPVKRSYIIALNEDDAIAIVTRKMIEEHPFFSKEIVYIESKNLNKNDYLNFTSLEALYDSLDAYLCHMKPSEWEKFKSIYPGELEVEDYYKRAYDFWDNLTTYFPMLDELRKSMDSVQIIKKYRCKTGGHLLFRPIGLIIVSNAIRMSLDGLTLKNALKRISLVSLELSDEPWSNLLWDKSRNRMYPYIGKESLKVSAQLLYYMIHGKLERIKMTEEKLRKDYAAAIKWDEEKSGKLELPLKVNLSRK